MNFLPFWLSLILRLNRRLLLEKVLALSPPSAAPQLDSSPAQISSRAPQTSSNVLVEEPSIQFFSLDPSIRTHPFVQGACFRVFVGVRA